MPSPLAHTAAGILVFRLFRSRLKFRSGWGTWIAAVFIVMSLLPDMDSAAGILFRDFGRYHNNLTHSLMFGVGVALLLAVGARAARISAFGTWFLAALLCYELHVVMDYFTIGRGVMLAWPFSQERFEPVVKLFYGLHWSDGWLNPRHLRTVVSESAIILGVWGLLSAQKEWRDHVESRSNHEHSGKSPCHGDNDRKG